MAPIFAMNEEKSRVHWHDFCWHVTNRVMDNLDVVEPNEDRDKHLQEMILIRGWKGDEFSTLSEARTLDGIYPTYYWTALMVAKSHRMFLEHHVNIPSGQVTPDEIRMAINSWIARTFHREWRLAASDMDPAHFPHGSMDALEANPDDPLDPCTVYPLCRPLNISPVISAPPKTAHILHTFTFDVLRVVM